MMKKITKKIAIGILGLFVFVVGISQVSAQMFNSDTGIFTPLFELAPKLKAYQHPLNGGSFIAGATTNANTLFRLFGTSLFDTVTTSGAVHFDNLLLGSGYAASSVPTTELHVAGSVQIQQLLDTTGLGNISYLCVNDFGVLSRCPGTATGLPACHTPAYPGGPSQQAIDNPTGCDGGIFFDIVDTNTEWKWGCRGIADSIALTPSDPSDALCSHPKSAPSMGR